MEKFRLQKTGVARGAFHDESLTALILGSGVHTNMSGANRIEAVLNGRACELRLITVAAQMPQENVLKIRGDKIRENSGRGLVAEMSMAAHDPLFDAPWTSNIVLQQLHVVIRFQNEDVGRTDSLHHQLGGVAKICKKADLTSISAEHETDWIVGIMRDGESFHANIANFEGGPSAENAEIESSGFKLKLDRFLGESITENGNGELVAERAKTVGVVGVFVREKNAAKTFGSASDLREAFADLFGAKTGIDQEAGFSIFQVGAIAVGTTAEDRELNRH